MNRLLGVALGAMLLSGCSDGGVNIVADGGVGPDSGDGTCAVVPSYGDVGTIPQTISAAIRLNDDTGQAKSVTYIGALNDDQDQVVIQLYRGFSVFTTGAIQPGTYEISGDELNYASCGVCVRMFADRLNGGGHPLQDMMATGGTLVVTAVGEAGSGVFQAELKNASFEHVHIDGMSFESTPVGDGCGTEISHLGADVPMAPAL
jgi:hypothetical protein